MTTWWMFVALLGVVTALPLQNNQHDDRVSINNSTKYNYPAESMSLTTLGGKKYLFSRETATFFEAMYFCNAFGMDLVSIETEEENNQIEKHIIIDLGWTASYLWTSGNFIGRAAWLWLTGDFMVFSDWGPGQPAQPSTDRCMVIVGGDVWADALCHWTGNEYSTTGFICEERTSIMTFDLDKTYKDYRLVYCLKQFDINELVRLIKLVRATLHICNVTTQRVFLALLGVVTAFPLQNSQQDDLVSRNITHYYPAESMSLTTLGGKKYLFSQEIATFYDAMHFCNAFGMDLVSLETAEENNLIKQHLVEVLGWIKSYIWTSGNMIGRSSWLWLTGDELNFSNWGLGGPLNPATDHCMIIQDGKLWIDKPCYCYSSTGFICEERTSS